MTGLSPKLNVYLILIAFSSLSCDRMSVGFNIATEIASNRKSKRDTLKSSSGIMAVTENNEKKQQRYCLYRLRDALQTVCSSGAGQIPLYFDPNSNQLYTSSRTSRFFVGNESGRKSRHSGNVISAMAHQNRPLLRRRSRRNIVRECCDKPCSYESMRKYCSPLTRSAPIPTQMNKNGKLSRSIRFHGKGDLATFGFMGLTSNKSDSSAEPLDNQIDNPPDFDLEDAPPYSIQCIPISELNSYFWKFYQSQIKKDGGGGPMRIITTTTTTSPTVETITVSTRNDYSNGFNGNIIENSTRSNTNAITTTIQHVDEFHFKISQNSEASSSSTEQWRKENEIKSERETISEKSRPINRTSNNAVTGKPITRYISLPRGTNDYIY